MEIKNLFPKDLVAKHVLNALENPLDMKNSYLKDGVSNLANNPRTLKDCKKERFHGGTNGLLGSFGSMKIQGLGHFKWGKAGRGLMVILSLDSERTLNMGPSLPRLKNS